MYPSSFEQTDDTNLQLQAQLETFILDFRLDNIFIYRYGAWQVGGLVAMALTISPETSCGRMLC